MSDRENPESGSEPEPDSPAGKGEPDADGPFSTPDDEPSEQVTGTGDSSAPDGPDVTTSDGSSGRSSADESERARDGGGRFGAERAVDYLKWAGVAVLAVTALVALFGFYTGVSRAITVWVTREYRPVVNAAFNFALLLVALGGIGLLLRRTD